MMALYHLQIQELLMFVNFFASFRFFFWVNCEVNFLGGLG